LAGAYVKSNIYLLRAPQQNESWYVYPRWSILFMWVLCPTFDFAFRSGFFFLDQNFQNFIRNRFSRYPPRNCNIG
jgi:hypothetical protein